MRKQLSLVIAATLIGTLFAGMPAAAEEKPYEGVTLRFAPIWAADAESDLGREMLAQFQEDTGINIELEEIAGDEMKNKISVDVASDNEPDVFQYWPGAVSRDLSAADVLADCSEYLEASERISIENFDESSLVPCTFDGVLKTLPRMGASAVLMINTELFDQYGLEAPATWDDLMAVAKVFRENGITTLNVGSKLGNPSHFFYNEIVCQFESGVQDVVNLKDPETATFKTDAMIYAANKIQEMVEAGVFAEDVLGSTGDWDPATAYYDEGYSAMCYTLSWEFSAFSDETLAKSKIIPMPQIAETDREPNHIQGTTNDCYCISKKAWADESKRGAITALVDFLLCDFVKAAAEKGYIITVDNVINSEIDYDALDVQLMKDVLSWRAENDIKPDPMIWQNLPGLAIQTDYCNALDELWAGAITGEEFIEKCEHSIEENS